VTYNVIYVFLQVLIVHCVNLPKIEAKLFLNANVNKGTMMMITQMPIVKNVPIFVKHAITHIPVHLV